MPLNFWRHSGEVLAAFCIPFGGGIPAGVILAEKTKLGIGVTLILYFISDIMLACFFEPLMLFFIRRTKDSEFTKRFIAQYKLTLERLGFHAGLSPSWYSLIVLSFGVDPMTGRVVAHAAGYGFFLGWAFAICGDMIFFALIMASTLWLNNVLGDGTIAALVAMAAMFAIPPLIRKLKSRLSRPKP
jgi:hypothetical protein